MTTSMSTAAVIKFMLALT